MSKISNIVERIVAERERQYNLPGTEYDVKNTPNDWVAIISYYATNGTGGTHRKIDQDQFEDSLVKAAAVIVASLEYADKMKERGYFR